MHLGTHLSQKTREGCGCPKFLAGKVFRRILTLLENHSLIFRRHQVLSLPRFGRFLAGKAAVGKIGPAFGNAPGFSPLRPPHSLLEFFRVFNTEYDRAKVPPYSEQLPCRSAEVKFFSVFLCQRCREIWGEILVKFSVLRFPGFGRATENFTKISRQKRCEKRKISHKIHSAGAQR